MSIFETTTAGPAPAAPVPTDRITDQGRKAKPLATSVTTTAGRKRAPEPPIDLERVVWDPEYRASVRDRLNRGKPAARPRTTRKAR